MCDNEDKNASFIMTFLQSWKASCLRCMLKILHHLEKIPPPQKKSPLRHFDFCLRWFWNSFIILLAAASHTKCVPASNLFLCSMSKRAPKNHNTFIGKNTSTTFLPPPVFFKQNYCLRHLFTVYLYIPQINHVFRIIKLKSLISSWKSHWQQKQASS